MFGEAQHAPIFDRPADAYIYIHVHVVVPPFAFCVLLISLRASLGPPTTSGEQPIRGEPGHKAG